MKLIHTSDLHIDSPLTSKLDPTRSRERKRELLASFRRTVQEAKAKGYIGIIIAGDLFDSENGSMRTLDYVIGIMENAPSVTFFYLPGNHEKDRLSKSGITLPENLCLFGEGWTYYALGTVKIIGRSTTSPDMFNSLTLNKNDTNILVLHGELQDKSDIGGKIGKKDIAAHPIDYIALGHYHTYSEIKISDRCKAVYCGTPEGRGFDEIGEKGYVLIDIDGGNVRSAFLPRAERTLHILPVNISGAERDVEIENRVAFELKKAKPCDICRIVLTGEHAPEQRRDTESLLKRFEGSVYYLEIKDNSRLRISSEDYKNDISLKGEFIRLVLGDENLSPDEKEKIIECGIRALAGEDV